MPTIETTILDDENIRSLSPIYQIHSDGSLKAPAGGWGYLLKNGQYYCTGSGSEPSDSVGRMELLGAFKGIRRAEKLEKRRAKLLAADVRSLIITLVTDAKYVIYGTLDPKSGPRKSNAGLWEQYMQKHINHKIYTSFLRPREKRSDKNHKLCHKLAKDEARILMEILMSEERRK